jgi:hypothetical protein
MKRLSAGTIAIDYIGTDIAYLGSSSLALLGTWKHTGKHYLAAATELPANLAYERVYLHTTDGTVHVINGNTLQKISQMDKVGTVYKFLPLNNGQLMLLSHDQGRLSLMSGPASD